MRDHRACAAQIAIDLFRVDRNSQACVEAVEKAAGKGAELVVLPELANVGYVDGHEPQFMRDFYDAAEPLNGPFVAALSAVAVEAGVHVAVGLAERHPRLTGVLSNSIVLLRPDGSCAVQRKTHIPREEKHYFAAGDELEPVDTELGRIGMLVCADNSFPEAGRTLTLRGAEILVVSYAAQRRANPDLYAWITAVRAYENQVFVVAANRTGDQGELRFGGRSAIAAPDGRLLAQLGEGDGLAIAELASSELVAERLRQTRFRDRRPALYRELTSTGDSW